MWKQSADIARFTHKLIKSGGRGAIKAAEKALGPSLGFADDTKWISKMPKRSDAKLSHIEACAGYLGMTLAEVVKRSTTNERGSARPVGKPPELVEQLSRAVGHGIDSGLMRNLWDSRFYAPFRVIATLEAAASRINKEQKESALSLSAICYQSVYAFNDAAWAFHLIDGPSPSTRLYKIYLLATIGAFDTSIEEVNKARLDFLLSKNIGGLGESMVVEAGCRLLRKERQIATELLNSANLYQNEMKPEYKSALLHLEGLTNLTSNPELANARLLEAYSISSGIGDAANASRALWVRAPLAEDPESEFLNARRAIPEFCIFDKALITIDLATFLLLKGRRADACTATNGLFAILKRFEKIPAVNKALGDLMELAFDLRLTEESLRRTRDEIEGCQAKMKCLAPRRLLAARDYYHPYLDG